MNPHTQNNVTAELMRSRKKIFHQTYAALMASLAYFVLGEIRSWSSSGIPSLQGEDGRNATLSQGPLPIEVASWITSTPPLAAILSALLAGFVLQQYGRKVTLLISVVMTFAAFLVLATSKIHEIPAIMILSRAMMGITAGFSMPSATIYVAECTDPNIRGLLGSLPSVLMALGISYVYLIGTFTPWHILAYICSIVPFFAILGIVMIPESPVWLMTKGRIDDAEKASKWLNGENPDKIVIPPHDDLDFLPNRLAKKDIPNRIPVSFFMELRNKSVWYPFGLCLVTMIFQQWSGVNAIIFNTVTIFNAANVSIDQYLATNIVGLVQLIATFMSILVVDKTGRRVLLLMSGIVMAIPLATIGGFFYLFNEEGSKYSEWRGSFEWLPLVCIIIYMIGYSIGYACVPFLLLGELLPENMRNLLGGAVSSFNLLLTFLVLKFFTNIHMSVGFHGLFWIYAVFSLCGSVFGYIYIPETKGKSLKEIESHFTELSLLKNMEAA